MCVVLGMKSLNIYSAKIQNKSMQRNTNSYVGKLSIEPVSARTHIYEAVVIESRRHSVVCIPQPRHNEIGTVSLPANSRYIGQNLSTLRHNWFSQLHFHFSHQSNTRLSINTTKYLEYMFCFRACWSSHVFAGF